MAGNRKSGDRKDAVKARYALILEQSNSYARFQRILSQTEKDENFLKAFEMAEDRASGKSMQHTEINDITATPNRDDIADAQRDTANALKLLGEIATKLGMAEGK